VGNAFFLQIFHPSGILPCLLDIEIDKNSGWWGHQPLRHNGTKLILRYSNMDCTPCIEETVDLLKKSEKFKNKFIILTDERDIRSFYIKKRNITHDFPIFLIKEGKLGLNFEGKGMPFMFLINKDFRISALFTPVTQQQMYTKAYLSSIAEKL